MFWPMPACWRVRRKLRYSSFAGAAARVNRCKRRSSNFAEPGRLWRVLCSHESICAAIAVTDIVTRPIITVLRRNTIDRRLDGSMNTGDRSLHGIGDPAAGRSPKKQARTLNQIPRVELKSVDAQRASHRRRLKVVHVTCVHPLRDPRIFEKECRSLAEDGHEVVLVAPHTRDEVLAGIRVRAIPPASSRKLRLVTSGWRAMAVALSERADLYNLHDPELLLPFQFA